MFGTSGIRGPVGDAVTTDLAADVGRALASAGYERVVLGRDPRPTGAAFADALSAGVRECGGDVYRVGVQSTPTVARSVAWLDADAGVTVTASHNPPTDNGVKLWLPSGKAFGPTERETIAERVEHDDFAFAAWDAFGSEHAPGFDPRARHEAALRDAVSLDGAPSVVVDVGNGAGGVTASALDALGCDVTTLNAQEDGHFPGRPSEPTPQHCAALGRFLARSDADFGVAHDGDADRMVAVTGDGEFVPGDVLLALFGRDAVPAGGALAAPVNTSLAVDDALADRDASVARTRVGDVHVADRLASDDLAFGGEPSGAWIWPAETLCPDGPLAAAKLAALVADRGPLADLAADVPQYPLRRESVAVEDKAGVMAGVRERVAARYDDVDDRDGVRVETDDGWFLVRASGTQPLVRVTAEARDERAADALRDTARTFVEAARGE
ncbi:phosphoglucosamine mutase [Halobacterium litoreum]|uniref:Phosphoglucosamine mutase n=1 Tax=Halobacterium litoreum TaxID=2039234 RepID=A0ABD5NBQ0_9EURY|nr:phosphoglucosamine mutase [Halobacterium litoreum]UHH14394.1 phosphoglucosamine mutase [Halobacterium litoreum]